MLHRALTVLILGGSACKPDMQPTVDNQRTAVEGTGDATESLYLSGTGPEGMGRQSLTLERDQDGTYAIALVSETLAEEHDAATVSGLGSGYACRTNVRSEIDCTSPAGDRRVVAAQSLAYDGKLSVYEEWLSGETQWTRTMLADGLSVSTVDPLPSDDSANAYLAATQPSSLKIENLSSTSVKLSWTYAGTAAKMWVMACRGKSSSPCGGFVEYVKKTSYTSYGFKFLRLSPDQRYTFFVKADGVSSPAAPYLDHFTLPSAPTSLTFKADFPPLSGTLSWSSPLAPSNGFRLVVSKNAPASCSSAGSMKVTTKTQKITDLLPNQTYSARLCAVGTSPLASQSYQVINEIEVGKLSFTLPDEPPPSVPKTLAASEITKDRAKITWTHAGEPTLKEFRYLLAENAATPPAATDCAKATALVAPGGTTARALVLSNLHPTSSYSLRLCALNHENDAASAVVNFRLPDMAVGEVLVIDTPQIVAPGWPLASGQGLGGSLLYAAPGTGTAKATWPLSYMPPGTYYVYTTWFEYSNRATNAPFTISGTGAAAKVVKINQKKKPNDWNAVGGAWEYLTTVKITGKGLQIVLANDADGHVVADAILLKRVNDGATAPPTVP